MVYKPKGRKFYLIEFHYRGKRILKRTKVTHIEDARGIESAIRTELERGNYGILHPKPLPSLAKFLKDEFLPYTEARFQKAKPNTAIYYRYGAKLLLASPLASLTLDAITDREAGQFIACTNPHRRPSTFNKGLETLRRALSVAHEWGRLGRRPRIALAKGARQRTRVLSQEEIQAYLPRMCAALAGRGHADCGHGYATGRVLLPSMGAHHAGRGRRADTDCGGQE